MTKYKLLSDCFAVNIHIRAFFSVGVSPFSLGCKVGL
jgi:hypothetical protein